MQQFFPSLSRILNYWLSLIINILSNISNLIRQQNEDLDTTSERVHLSWCQSEIWLKRSVPKNGGGGGPDIPTIVNWDAPQRSGTQISNKPSGQSHPVPERRGKKLAQTFRGARRRFA